MEFALPSWGPVVLILCVALIVPSLLLLLVAPRVRRLPEMERNARLTALSGIGAGGLLAAFVMYHSVSGGGPE